VRLPIYATWSNGRYDPPARLLPLVEDFEARQLSLSEVLGLKGKDSENREQLLRIAMDLPNRLIDIEDLGKFRVVDLLAARNYGPFQKFCNRS
jgi:hypothetical protein